MSGQPAEAPSAWDQLASTGHANAVPAGAQRWLGVLCAASLLGVLLTSCGASAQAATVQGAPGVRLGPGAAAFYRPPSPLPSGANGSLVWALPIQAPTGARAWKILYRSTLATGRRVAVSGIVVAPRGAAPPDGRPVVAWAHGTTGEARRCAPSMVDDPARNLVNYFSFQRTEGRAQLAGSDEPGGTERPDVRVV